MNFRPRDLTIAAAVVFVVMLIIIPVPTGLMDILLITNISISLVILMMALYIKEPLEFASFPSVLLIVTLFRLALNIRSTTLILGNNGNAGAVITTFGNFVIGGNIVVGFIVFIIIILVQFIVITKGAERVAEVAARFTLDAMPGKQMAIDADLNSGLIDEQGAKSRRLKIQREADFYGAMDGSSKFVKGDAILGILITMINIVGGLIIGMTGDSGMTTQEVLTTYSLATVGDGLCSQIPALLVSTATGIIVTRAASDNNLGEDLMQQFTAQPYIFYIVSAVLLVFCVIPGMPVFAVILIALGFATLGIVMTRAQQRPAEAAAAEEAATLEAKAQADAAEMRKPENVVSLLQVDLIGIEFGYGLIPLVDTSQNGDLLERVVMIRRQCAMDLGIIVPVIRLRDNIQLGTNQYSIKIKGVEVASGSVMIDHFLALGANDDVGKLNGVETVDPTFGLPAYWIEESEKEKAELFGYTTIDPPSVIATHITEVIKRHASELLSRQQIQLLLDNLKTAQPALVDEVVPKLFSLGELQRVFSNLLDENIPIRDLTTILETLADYSEVTRDLDLLSEYVRQALSRAISKRFVQGKKVRVITVDADVEQLIVENIKKSEQGTYVALDQKQIQGIFTSLKSAVERFNQMGITPIVLTSPVVRMHFKKISAQLIPDLTVLSYNELEQDVEIFSDGMVTL